jgi:ribokinase
MRKPSIVVVGSLNMDIVISMQRMPKIGETLLGKEIHYISGGKGANQAVGCARLGADVTMIGALGDDMFGGQIMNRMEHFGVTTSAIAIINAASTGTAAILHTENDNCIIIIPGANALCTPEWINRYADTIRSADILLVQLEIPLPAVESAMRIANASGVKIILNPAPALPLTDELIQMADIFTPNETEFDYYCGSPSLTEQELLDRISQWQLRYGKTLIVTRGEVGVSCGSGKGVMTIPAPQVSAVDTTGAGDSFNAALGYAFASGWDLQQSLAFAVKSASLSVMKFGAQDGMPSFAEVNNV